MKIIKGYKVELNPNNKQRTALLQHAGVARFAYNWGLNQKKIAFDKEERTPNAIELHKLLNSLKSTDFPWMYCCSKCAPQEALRNLDKAFDNFFRKCKLKKQGKHKGKTGFPQFKSKHNGIGSFRLTGTIKVNDGSVQLPRVGIVRLKESGYISTQDVKILSATVSEKAGRWFVSIQVEQYVPDPPLKTEAIVGVDLGIKTLATCSDGIAFDNPKALGKNLKKLQRLSRSVSRKQKGGKNRKKAVNRLARLHYRISCIRKDAIHKVTTQLTKTKSCVAIEDLCVSDMLKNRKYSRSNSDVGYYEFRRQLEYKGQLYGCKIKIADRYYPSSKMCSNCGAINIDLTLNQRTWKCCCGVKHDRDGNAAINLERVATSSLETLNAYEERFPLAS